MTLGIKQYLFIGNRKTHVKYAETLPTGLN